MELAKRVLRRAAGIDRAFRVAGGCPSKPGNYEDLTSLYGRFVVNKQSLAQLLVAVVVVLGLVVGGQAAWLGSVP